MEGTERRRRRRRGRRSTGKKWLGGRVELGKPQPTVTAGMARCKGEIALRWINGRRQIDVGGSAACFTERRGFRVGLY